MKKYLLSLLCLTAVTMLSAQNHVMSVGVRAGGSHFLQKMATDSVGSKAGFNGGLDLGYTYYFAPKGEVQWGVHTGLGIGFSTSHLTGSLHEEFTNTDMYGNAVDYTVDFERVDERSRQVQLEIPVMAAMRWRGLVVNVGPKFMIPVWKQATQNHTLPVIDAYYPLYDVHVTDEMITGAIKTDEDLNGKGKWCAPSFSFMLGAEIGYEFALSGSNLLGVMATVNVSCASAFKNEPNGKVVEVGNIENTEYPVPEITIHSLSNAVVSNMHPLDFGVKVYYAFDLQK